LYEGYKVNRDTLYIIRGGYTDYVVISQGQIV